MNNPPWPVTLHPAEPSDVPLIRCLADEIWRACYPGMIPAAQIDFMLASMYAPEKLTADLQGGKIQFYLIQVSGQTGGFASLGPGENAGEVHLHKFYLRPALHGRGIGSQALQLLFSEAAALGGRAISLRVNRQNQRAIRAYERNGMRVDHSVCSEIGGGFVMDDYWMIRSLP